MSESLPGTCDTGPWTSFLALASVHAAHLLVQQDENIFASPVQELPVEFPAVIADRPVIPDRPPQEE
ncbi:hypothetical protein [Pseudarthrobacter cellobiosi]|uniref:hypothetical protein n=1 Tax=Pseudarthrobacter cellobiosi TaxID=2953654 RepID=UPI00208F6464|nr:MULTISPECIES: hypothetical protein [unclassified Pseudarthrobacter]MCO4273368.1 hypothetical protein [Pseudarthrobacter sp. HLT3-5]